MVEESILSGGYRTTEPLQMKVVCLFETSGNTYPVTQCHILEEQIPVINPVGLGLYAVCALQKKIQEFKWLALLCMFLVMSLYCFGHCGCTLCIDCSWLSVPKG